MSWDSETDKSTDLRFAYIFEIALVKGEKNEKKTMEASILDNGGKTDG